MTPSQPTSCACFDSWMHAAVMRAPVPAMTRMRRRRAATRPRLSFSFRRRRGTVATGAALDADAINPHLDLIIDNLSKRVLVYREIRSRAEPRANKFSPARMLLFGLNSAPNSGRIPPIVALAAPGFESTPLRQRVPLRL